MKKNSKFRNLYIKRLIIRVIILLVFIMLFFVKPNSFMITKGLNFFSSFSPLHILWLIWMIDMVLQLCNVSWYWPLGSQKYLKNRYIPNVKEIDIRLIKNNMKKINIDCISVAITWILFVSIFDILYLTGVLSFQFIILLSIFFYVCDTICVIYWCPFKTFFMHNKCCTTCRIFNWDHAMMFLPLIIIPGVFTYSLVIMSFIVLIIWEINCATHPERFLEKTNVSLRCHNCTDRLCGK